MNYFFPSRKGVLGFCLLASTLFVQPWLGYARQSSSVVAIENSQPNWARAANDLGRVAGTVPLPQMRLFLRATPSQGNALRELLLEQRDPTSANFHRWLTPEEYGERFGMPQESLNSITTWLKNQGFGILAVARGHNWISFSGSVAQAEAAFRTELHYYRLGTETHFTNSAPPALPTAIATQVAAIEGLDDLPDVPANRAAGHRTIQQAKQGAAPSFTSSSGVNSLAPADLATIYDFAPLWNAGITGSGISIAVVGESDINPADINAFRSTFGIPPITVQTVLVPGFSDPGFTSDETEADLDLEWTGGVAPGAKIIFVENSSAFGAGMYAVDQNLAPIISQSFETCEPNLTLAQAQARQAVVQQGNAEGITWVAGAGDSGAAACDGKDEFMATLGPAVNNPTSIPEVTSIGGTEFNEGNQTFWGGLGPTGGTALSYIPEMVWNDNAFFASEDVPRLAATGGGVSIYFPQPAWQTGISTVSSTARMLPDIAFTASSHHDPYIVCSEASTRCTGLFPPTTFSNVGGTSAPTPMFAGIVALLNQYLLAAGSIPTPGLGNINPNLYEFALTTPTIFHDVTVGSNREPCLAGSTGCPAAGNYGFDAGPGYDAASGLGSVDAMKLAQRWAASSGSAANVIFAAANGATTASVSPGQTATYSLALTPVNGFSGSFALSCTGAPAEAACNVPGNANVSGATVAVTVSVMTTAQSSSPLLKLDGTRKLGPMGWQMIWLMVSVVAMMTIVLGAHRTRKHRTAIACVTALTLLLAMTGCGAGTAVVTPPPPSNPGTPAGTNTLTVTATSGSVSRSVVLTLTVN